jgi:hypothetical protein
MKALRQLLTTAVAALAALVLVSPTRADYVASPEEVRALRAKLARSPPKPADYAAQPYPGAKFDADCSAEQTAPRQTSAAVYCFYTRDSVDTVRAFVKGAGKPKNGVSVTVEEGSVSVDGVVKISNVTVITYWTNRSTMAFYESFPADPPPAADLIAPLYPGATYDKECSAKKNLDAKGNPKWRQVWCYVAEAPAQTINKAFDSEITSTSRRGVQVDLVEVSRTPPVTQIQYWLTTAPPKTTTPTQSNGSSVAVTSPKPDSAAASASASASASAPAPAEQDVAKQTKDTINKLRGLFGK